MDGQCVTQMGIIKRMALAEFFGDGKNPGQLKTCSPSLKDQILDGGSAPFNGLIQTFPKNIPQKGKPLKKIGFSTGVGTDDHLKGPQANAHTAQAFVTPGLKQHNHGFSYPGS